MCKKGFGSNFVIQPELTSVVCLDIYFATASTTCKPFSIFPLCVVYMFVCIFTCVWMPEHVCVPARGLHWLSSSIILYLVCFEV